MAEGLQVRAYFLEHTAEGEFGPGELSRSIALTGFNRLAHTQDIDFAAEEALQIGEVAAGGWFLLENLDSTNFVELRSVAGETPFAKVLAREFAGPFRLGPSAVPTAQADTASVRVRYWIRDA